MERPRCLATGTGQANKSSQASVQPTPDMTASGFPCRWKCNALLVTSVLISVPCHPLIKSKGKQTSLCHCKVSATPTRAASKAAGKRAEVTLGTSRIPAARERIRATGKGKASALLRPAERKDSTMEVALAAQQPQTRVSRPPVRPFQGRYVAPSRLGTTTALLQGTSWPRAPLRSQPTWHSSNGRNDPTIIIILTINKGDCCGG